MPNISRRSFVTGAAALPALTASVPLRLPHKVRVAVIGVEGHVAEVVHPLPLLPDVEVVAAADRDARELEHFARIPQLKGIRTYSDYRQMLDREKIDVAAICNSDGERAGVILDCLSRKLNVIAEKPLALDMHDLDRIRKAVAETGIRISMLLPMRFQREFLALKQVVESGELGEVAQISAQKSYKLGNRPAWMRNRAEYGSTMAWIGIHMVDLMRWTSGRELREAASYEKHIGFPETAAMENATATIFLLDNGGVASLHMDFLRPESESTHGDDRLRLAGTKGIVEYQDSIGVTLASTRRAPVVLKDLPAERSLFYEYLDSIYNGKPAPVSMEDAFRVTEIVLRTHLAAERHTFGRL